MGLLNIKLTEESENGIYINGNVSEKLGTNYIRSSVLRFGMRVAEIEVIHDNKLKDDELLLSKRVAEKLNVPLSCDYEILINANKEFVIGPFIGIYMGRKKATLLKKLRLVNSFAAKYTEVNGTVFAFTLDTVQKTNFMIKGYFYNPKMDRWEESTLPYPSTIFLRNTMNTEWREHFKALYGNNIFNYKPFDKWEMFQKLEQFPESLKVIPQTLLYKNADDVLNMLDKYHNLYVKPIGGKKGLGIFNVVRNEEGIVVQTRENQENLKWVMNDEEFLRFMQEKLIIDKFVIQETIDLQIDNKVMDFRVGMEKDIAGDWTNKMFITRLSGDSSIVSNRAAGGGTIITVEQALKEIYRMSDEMVEEYTKKLLTVAKESAINLEKTGLNLGKLAFDLAIDKNRKIWIIEINSRYPDDSLANKIGDKEMYYEIRNTNMLYAKKLAGFGDSTSNLLTFKDSLSQSPCNELKRRFKVLVSIPRDQRNTYYELVQKISMEYDVTGKLNFNNLTKKVDIEVEGGGKQVEGFLSKINVGENIQSKSVISISEIKPLDEEQGFRNVMSE
ncbi:YheC/YheD family protein [Oceanobacillus kapialis]|uniref:YheC/YheD family endospore coat-associated protein n=1 Tax=Oceanobacillus kapialis TaxID=481353 RepID=UPI00384D4EB6